MAARCSPGFEPPEVMPNSRSGDLSSLDEYAYSSTRAMNDFWDGGDSDLRVARIRAVRAAFASGWQDLARLPLLTSTVFVVVSIAALSVLLSPLLGGLTRATESYVASTSELVIALEPVEEEVIDRINRAPGVEFVWSSTDEDLERVGKGWNAGAARYTIHPSGDIDVETLQARLVAEFPEILDIAQTVGTESTLAVRLMEVVLPWLAGAFSVAGVLIVIYMALLVGRIRADEAEMLGLIGSTPFDAWLRLGCVIFIPAGVAVVVTSTLTVVLAPRIAALFLPPVTASHISGIALVGTAIFLLGATLLTAAVAGFLGMRLARQPA